MKTLLVTGGAGFIGSNFISWVLDSRPNWQIVNLDALTYAGNPENLSLCCRDPRYTFIQGDIRDREQVNRIFSEYTVDAVVHFAAETHVDRSIEEPEVFLTTNGVGTQVLLDAAKTAWKIHPEDKRCREYRDGVRYIQISTDEVYGALGPAGKFTEETPLAPNSPYAASKAAGDLMVRAYSQTFGFPAVITRCSNNYGPFQFPEKLIPLMVRNALMDQALPVYGDGLQVRDWLHVTDHCTAIAAVLERGEDGEVYNIGGNNEMTNLAMVEIILDTLGKPRSLIRHVPDRPGHDRRYAIDNRKITQALNWRPRYTLEHGLRETVQWYVDNRDWLERVVSGQYRTYYARMYRGIE